MKHIIFSILAAAVFVFSACHSYIPAIESNQSVQKVIKETEMPNQSEQAPSPLPEPIITQKPNHTVTTKETTEPMKTLTPLITAEPTQKPTEKPTVAQTEKPTNPQTPEPTVMPTPTPTVQPTEEPEIEITAVSSSYINAAMAEINRLRGEDGIEPAVFSSSMSSSCQSHAVSMAERGTAFHASGGYVFEAVGRASRYMSGTTMGGAAANHVVQLQSAEVTQIGIGAVYYGDYVFYVVRGS